MPVLPDKKLEMLAFAEQHLSVWLAQAANIGLTIPAVNLIKTATMNARASYTAATTARQTARAATTQADNDLSTMHNLVSDAIKQIRLYAETTNNPNVFALGQIPPPAPPTPAMPPTQPIALQAVIESMGQLMIQWRIAAATQGFDDSTVGVTYIIRRRVNNQTGFTIVGTARPSRAGRRGFSSFTDVTIPSNPSNLQYVVQGKRGDLEGMASDVFSVTLGVSGDGLMFVQDAQNIKMAA